MSRPSRSFAGVKISPVRSADIISDVSAALRERRRLTVTFVNPDYLLKAFRDPGLTSSINAFDRVLVDGNGIRLLAPLFGYTVPERLDTDSLAPSLFRALATQRGRVFLFGCAPGVAEEAARRLSGALPDLVIGGTEHGYYDVLSGHPGRFSPEDTDRIIDSINAAATDLLLVSLPTPLQQSWLAAQGHRIDAPVIVTAGSYLDHLAASQSLGAFYPRWVNALGLNWLYRLAHEPRRLWRRYTVESVEFAIETVRRRLRPGSR